MASERMFLVEPGGRLQGELRVPGDKSISHRAIMLGALAEGRTRITGFLEGEDSLATLRAFRAMGVPIVGPANGCVTIAGVGLHGLKPPTGPLDLGNSGTSMRLLAGLLSGQTFDTTLIGDESLSRRPMQRIADPLNAMEAWVETSPDGTPPLIIHGRRLHGIDYVLPVASAQVKSSILLAGLYAEGETCITEPAVTRDHTERMLESLSWPVRREGRRVSLQGGRRLLGRDIVVPGDISSAAFFMVAATMAPGSDIVLRDVGINPTRTGVITILRLMGANIEIINECQAGAEPIADIRVRASDLHGIDIPLDLVPLAIDEFPAIFVAAACATGRTRLQGAAELRVKESDRIAVMAAGLQAIGARAEPLNDGMIIEGGPLRGGEVDSHGDHRIAMALAIAALRASDVVKIHHCANVATSFPGFVELARDAGLMIKEVDDVA